jgi:hypothetical protein
MKVLKETCLQEEQLEMQVIDIIFAQSFFPFLLLSIFKVSLRHEELNFSK